MTTAHQITWRERLEAYYYLCRFDKPVGTELVFWPTMWALWIAAEGIPPIGILIPMVLGTIFMRAAGCAINDFADRKVDAHVERTENAAFSNRDYHGQRSHLCVSSFSICQCLYVVVSAD